jgi:hypothetical protein
MKFRRIIPVMLALCPAIALAQHVELGAFADFSRQNVPHAAEHLFGAGARADVNIIRVLQLEVEGAYDFKYPHFETAPQTNAVVLNSTSLGVFHANAGLKVQTRGGSVFGFIKGGINQYRTESQIQTVAGAPVTVSTVRFPDATFSKGVLYPGVGLGFHAGPLGIRFDVGDEITWVNGSTNNSLRITVGPTFRF